MSQREEHREQGTPVGGARHLLPHPHPMEPAAREEERTPRRAPAVVPAPETQLAGMWRVIVLNDPVNRMSYVVMVLRRVLGFSEESARRHMLEVHESGRSVVWTGTREQAEAHMFALQQWHLTAIIQPEEA
jgi:ATP-dependent Clp protease adaptor protein ClpS